MLPPRRQSLKGLTEISGVKGSRAFYKGSELGSFCRPFLLRMILFKGLSVLCCKVLAASRV